MEQNDTAQYELQKEGVRKLEYSVIPDDELIKRRLFIDEETDTFIMRLALREGLHVQELYRRIIWNFIYNTDLPIKDLIVKLK